MEANELSEFETVPVLNAVSQLNRASATSILVDWLLPFRQRCGEGLSVEEYVAQELAYPWDLLGVRSPSMLCFMVLVELAGSWRAY